VELTANFEAIVYNITYNLDGGSNHAGNPSTYTVEDAVSLQAPAKQGNDFAGWIEGDEIAEGSTGDRTFTAQWAAYSSEANIEYIAVNGRDITKSENEGVFEYIRTCGESDLPKTLTLRVSPKASVKLGETQYPPQDTELETTLDVNITSLSIAVTSQSGKTNTWTLEFTGVIDGALLYILRWNDVLGINSNPDNNGGRIIDNEHTRWYNSSDDTEIGSGDYIEITGAASDYYAVIELEGERLSVCHPTKATEIKAYPNPVMRGGTVTLELPESFKGSILNIYNINGALVKSGQTLPATVNSIDLSEHVPGIYLLQITAKNGNCQAIKIISE
jgi:hypothetical protein